MESAEFKRASHAVWEAMAPGWDDRHAYFEERARPVVERMLERLAPQPGQTILELAAGTGVVGFAAAALVAPGGRVVVSDFLEAMVEAAQRQAAALGLENVSCRVLDAEQLDVPDASVDGVLCRWGYMLMADPEAAFRETRRVLRDGGRLSCAVFAEAEKNPWVGLPSRVLQEPRLDEVAFTWRFGDPNAYWDFLAGAAGAIALVLGRLDDDERARVKELVLEAVPAFSGSEGIELPAASLVASAS
jgi:ubiquinone/menaquinone biosynthesis C-methylase UbiE